DSVSSACRSDANARACSVALAYLAALDLDRADAACALLMRSTLDAGGGMAGCTKTLLAAKGVRIHYSIAAAEPSLLGTTIRFSTWTQGGSRIRQQMAISPKGRIIAVVPELE